MLPTQRRSKAATHSVTFIVNLIFLFVVLKHLENKTDAEIWKCHCVVCSINNYLDVEIDSIG